MKKTENMRQVLEKMESDLAGRRMIRFMEGERVCDVLTEDFFAQVRNIAGCIVDNGLQGKHIGVLGKNSCQWLAHLCAVFWSGSVAVLLNCDTDSGSLRNLAKRVDLSAVMYDAVSEELIGQTFFENHVCTIPFCQWNGRPAGDGGKQITVEKKGNELGCIFFTSGTTAESKAVMMSESALAAGVCHRINSRKFESFLAVLPFHHLSGFSSVLNAWYLGAEVCIAEELKYFFEYLRAMKPDYIFVVPSMLRMLARKLKNGGDNGCRFGWNLRLINCGGASFCPEVLQTFLDRKIVVLQGYGASEAGAIGFLREMTMEHPDTIGKPSAELEAKIEDGELYLRSKAVMTGYYGDEEETRKVLGADGWYATGDLCRQDEEGLFYLTGRRKNVIILENGENVSPEEVEAKLYQCPDICEVAVGTERSMIRAEVYPQYPKGCSEEQKEEVRKCIRQAIAQYNDTVPVYKQIQKVNFSDSPLKKTSVGKVVRH